MAYQVQGPQGQGPIWMQGPALSDADEAKIAAFFRLGVVGVLIYLFIGPLGVVGIVRGLFQAALAWLPSAAPAMLEAAGKGAAIGTLVALYRRWRVRRREARDSIGSRARVIQPSVLVSLVSGAAIGIAAAAVGLLGFSPRGAQAPSPAQTLFVQCDLLLAGGGAGGSGGGDVPVSLTMGAVLAILIILALAGMVVGAIGSVGLGAVLTGGIAEAAQEAARAAAAGVDDAISSEYPETAHVWAEASNYAACREYFWWLSQRGPVTWGAVADSMGEYADYRRKKGKGRMAHQVESFAGLARMEAKFPIRTGPAPEQRMPANAHQAAREGLARTWEAARDGAASGWLSGILCTVIGIHVTIALGQAAETSLARAIFVEVVVGAMVAILLVLVRRMVRGKGV